LQIPSEKSSSIAIACLVLCVSGCGDPEPIAAEPTTACGTDGALVTEIYGGVRASIEWDAGVLECHGMPRPNGEGARMRFAGPATTADGERHLAFILGLPDLRRGETAKELPTNVTLMEEGAGRFYGTRDTANCWTDVEVHEQIQPTESTTYSVSGVLYCVAPLAELNGKSNVSFTDLTFTGHVNWGVPK
jgi:hypothetical protein